MLQNSKIVLAKGVRVIGSVMHFTFQTAADLVLEGEVKALNKLDVYDLTSKELRRARMERTKLIRYRLKQTSNMFLKRSKPSSKSEDNNGLIVQLINE